MSWPIANICLLLVLTTCVYVSSAQSDNRLDGAIVLEKPLSRTLSETKIAEDGSKIEFAVQGDNALQWNCEWREVYSPKNWVNAVPVRGESSEIKARWDFLFWGDPVWCTQHVLTLVLSADDGFQIDVMENITFDGAFLSRAVGVVPGMDGLKGTIDISDLEEPVSVVADRPRVSDAVPQWLLTVAKISGGAAVFASSIAGFPLVAVLPFRGLLLLDKMECRVLGNGTAYEDEFGDWTNHPFQLKFSEQPGAVNIGAIVTNCVLVLLFVLIHFGVCVFRGDVPLKHSQRTLHFPSLSALVAVPLLHGTAKNAVAAFAIGELTQNYVAAVFGVLCCVAYLSVVIHTMAGFKARALPIKNIEDMSIIRRFLRGTRDWIDDVPQTKHRTIVATNSRYSRHGEGFVAAQFLLFHQYGPKRHYFCVFEVIATIAFGFVDGWVPKSKPECTSLIGLSGGLNTIYLIVLLALRPLNAKFYAVTHLAAASSLFFASVGLFISKTFGFHIFVDLGQWCVVFTLFGLLGRSLIDAILMVAHLCTSKRAEDEGPSDEEDAPLDPKAAKVTEWQGKLDQRMLEVPTHEKRPREEGERLITILTELLDRTEPTAEEKEGALAKKASLAGGDTSPPKAPRVTSREFDAERIEQLHRQLVRKAAKKRVKQKLLDDTL